MPLEVERVLRECISRGARAALLGSLLVYAGVGLPAEIRAAEDERPNIVVFYIDDANPIDGRLWSSEERTPAIYRTFIEHGIEFSHAFGEDPLCCPGRGSLLTGLHTHNNGVDANDARLFTPQEHVGQKLKDAGYTTMWIGKYMNRNNDLAVDGWKAHLAPWSVFDGIYGFNGDYYDYDVRTRDSGDIHYGEYHSTLMVADRAVMRLSDAPADKPIFAVLSTYNLHGPNTPMPVPESLLAMCDSMPPWDTPAFNEADVSDKPAYIRELPLLSYAGGWPMDQYCREMFGIDRLVQRVEAELQAEGRLDNSLLIFTADNGMTWGAHRKGQQKNVPYATQVPLYMSFPARWGSDPRTIDEYISNIDLAPTFCDLGACRLGPYPSGQEAADGQSLVPLIEQGQSLGRTGLLESSPVGDAKKGIPGWSAIRTTPHSNLGLWHYVEYTTGERELYDLGADPYELENMAGKNAYEAVQDALARQLDELLNEGRINRPDLSAWAKKAKLYAGYNLFDSDASAVQTLSKPVQRLHTYTFKVDLENNMTGPDSFIVRASTSNDRVKVTWILGGADVTAQIGSSAGLTIDSLAGGATRNLVLQVKVKRRFPIGTSTSIDVIARSAGDPARDDHVTIVAHR